jgi:hypothetical protein
MKQQKRVEKLEEQQPEINYKSQLIDLCQQWYDAIWEEDFDAALQARKDAKALFEQAPKWKEETPYCRKVLYIHWKWFVRYLKTDVQELIRAAVEMNRWPGSLARPEDFD